MLETAIHEESVAALNHVLVKHPGLKKRLEKAHGYIVFPSVGRAGVVLGGSHGHGEVYEEGKPIGFAMLSQITVGVQVGGQTFTELVMFDNKNAFEDLKHAGRVGFTANASAVIVKAAATGTSNTAGAEAMAFGHGGMLLELSLGGSSFQFVPPMTKPEPGHAFTPRPAPRSQPAPSEQAQGEQAKAAPQQEARGEEAKTAPEQPQLAPAAKLSNAAKAAMQRAKTAVSTAGGEVRNEAAKGGEVRNEAAKGGEMREGMKSRFRDTLGKVMPTDRGKLGQLKDQTRHLAGQVKGRVSNAQHKATRLKRVARLHGSAIKLMGQLKETLGRTLGKEQFITAGKAQKLEGLALEQANR